MKNLRKYYKRISLSNPIIKRLLGGKAYQAYAERQGGDEDE